MMAAIVVTRYTRHTVTADKRRAIRVTRLWRWRLLLS